METKTKSLFGMAKEKTPAKTKAKEKASIEIEGIADKIKRFNELAADFENIETELEILKAELKTYGKENFLELFKKEKKKPESFKLASEGLAVLYMATDKYAKVDDTKAEILLKYDGLLDSSKTYILNSEVLEKPGIMDAISEALMNCEELTEGDKENLLTVKSEYWVKKGTLERLDQYENPQEVFELIQPVCMLKRC